MIIKTPDHALRMWGKELMLLESRLSGMKHWELTWLLFLSDLDESEEKELMKFVVKSAAMSYGKTKHEVFAILERTLKKKGELTDHLNSKGWWI